MVPFVQLVLLKQLFRVLNLLASFLDIRLHSQPKFGDARAFSAHPTGLREQRVGLSIHLLQQKVQLLANLHARGQQTRSACRVFSLKR